MKAARLRTTFAFDRPSQDAYKKLPRDLKFSAYVRTMIKLLVYSQDECYKEYDKNEEFRGCIKSIKNALKKIN